MTTRNDIEEKESIRKIEKKIYGAGLNADENTQWLKCPACGEEWNKLHPCDYSVNGVTQVSHLCVQCAEGVKSLLWLKGIHPIPGVHIEIKKWKAYIKIHREAGDRTHYYAVILGAGPEYWAVSQYSPPLVLINKEDMNDKKYFSNIFNLWFHVDKLSKEKKEVKEEEWEGKNVQRKKRHKN